MRQPLDEEESDKSNQAFSKFARLAQSVSRNRSLLLEDDANASNMEDNKKEDKFLNAALASDVLPQYKQETPQPPPHIILHYGLFKSSWDWLMLLITCYTATVVPFCIAFLDTNHTGFEITVLDSMVDILYFIDIVLSFHTTFVGVNGEVISDPEVIRFNYLKGWFILDFITCLPYDLLGTFHTDDNEDVSSIFNALRLIQLLRFGRILRQLDRYVEHVVAALLLMIFGFLLLAHFMACIWFAVGIADLKNGHFNGWLPRLMNDISMGTNPMNVSTGYKPEILPPRFTSYTSSLYFTLTLVTSIGFGNIYASTELEKIISTGLMLAGSLIYATIFGNVTTMVQQMYATRQRYQEMMNNVKEFLKIHDVPLELGDRVLDYVTSSWAVTKGIDTTKVLNYCPKDMKADLCVHLNRMVFNEHPAFRLASDGCLRSLAVNFISLHTAPGDLIFHQGESIDQLCFVVSGSLEVIQDEEIVGILSKGDVFGDYVWKDASMGLSSASIRALTYCDLHCIKRHKLMEVLQFHQAFSNSFARNLILTFNLRTRIVFRKIADVKKERELAEKRKNEPNLSGLSADHPVRKLISRFRRINESKTSGEEEEEEEEGGNNEMGGSKQEPAEEKAGGSDEMTPTEEENISGDKTSGPGVGKKTSFKFDNSNEEGAKEATKVKLPQKRWAKRLGKGGAHMSEDAKESGKDVQGTYTKATSGLAQPSKNQYKFKKTRIQSSSSMIPTESETIPVERTEMLAGNAIRTMETGELHVVTISISKIRCELKDEMNQLDRKMDQMIQQIEVISNFFSNYASRFSIAPANNIRRPSARVQQTSPSESDSAPAVSSLTAQRFSQSNLRSHEFHQVRNEWISEEQSNAENNEMSADKSPK